MSKITIAEKLLLASVELRQNGETFTAEDLVVHSWKMYPDTFGLAGYSDDHPDSNRVLTNIMGSKGMRGKGWIQKVGQKQYKVTSEGLSKAIQIAEKEGNDHQETQLRGELKRDVSKALQDIISTRAAKKILSRKFDNLSFHDACGFWDITVRSNAKTLRVQLADTKQHLEQALEALDRRKSADSLNLPDVTVDRSDIEKLLEAHFEMQERFKADLGMIRERTDERK